MRRREVTAALLLTAAAPQALAQQPGRRRRIAVIAAVLPVFRINETEGGTPWRAFFTELRRLGYIEDRNLVIERYSAEGQPERAAELARYVVSRNPDLIVTGTGFLARAAAAATDTIPIVSALPAAWRQGLVESLARPGRNITGVSTDAGIAIWGKRLQMLKEAVPSASRIAYLGLRDSWDGLEGQELRDAGQKLGISLVGKPLSESTRSAYQDGLAELRQHSPEAMIVSGAGGAWAQRQLIVDGAEKNRLPAIHPYREWIELGGLMAYATDLADVWRRIAGDAHQILNGAKPADIPVYQATKFSLVINLKAAQAIGLSFPPALLARADEVTE